MSAPAAVGIVAAVRRLARHLIRAACGAAVALAGTGGAAGGPEGDPPSARGLGHAGAALVSDDGLGALLGCPAGLARRGELRAQLGGAIVEDDVGYTDGLHPTVGDRGASALSPTVVGVGTLGPLVLGAGFAVTETFDRRLPAPGPDDDAATAALYPHRYAGTEVRWSRRTLALAGAWRATDWLAIGAGLTLAQVELREARRLWAGFDGRDPLGEPGRDVAITLSGSDGLVPGGALGAFVAPASVPLELALGAAWSADVHADGDATLATRSPVTILAPAPRARARYGSPLTVHAGARWLGERYAVEAALSAWLYPTGHRAWDLTGVRLVDESGVEASVLSLATRLAPTRRLAGRAAVDLEAVPGWLWLSLGYGYAVVAGDAATDTTAAFDPGGHTLGGGLEVTAGPATLTLGVARHLAARRTTTAPGLAFDNPFAGGAGPANLGRHEASRDEVAVAVELALP